MKKPIFLKEKKGFTLIEILVAIAILGLILAVIYPSFAISFKVSRSSKAKSQIYNIARIAMERMTNEISAAYIPPVLPAAASSSAGTSKNVIPSPKSFYVFQGINQEDEGFPNDQIVFTPAIYKFKSPESRQTEFSEIEYFLSNETDEEGKKNLYRREDPTLNFDFNNGGFTLEMGESLKGLDFLYYDDDGEESEEWDSTGKTQGKRLPRAVKITLIFEDDQKQINTFSTTVEINIKS